uniref:Uncharacterized protein n=1 Tax=Paramormyrops kingsleyae TaxID=1676925 RepID=A0A3B3SIS1_9TELE
WSTSQLIGVKVSWNVGSAVPPDDVTSLLGLNTTDVKADMYIIG